MPVTKSEFKPYAPDFEDGEYLNAAQKRKICQLLRREDHKKLYVIAANHVGASKYDLENERALDQTFDLAIKEIDSLWDQWLMKQSIDMSYEAEGTAAERMRHVEAANPEKYSQKFKLDHEVHTPNPKLIEAVKNALAKKRIKAVAA